MGDEVAEAVLQQYKRFGPRGRPQGREWTVLAGLVVHDTRKSAGEDDGRGLRVVAVATGNKCLGRSKMTSDGSVLHDSHAEVLVRRAFLLLLWKELGMAIASHTPGKCGRGKGTSPQASEEPGVPQGPAVEDKEYLLENGANGRWRLKPYLKLHLYVSDPPCGDASIYERTSATDEPAEKDTVFAKQDDRFPSIFAEVVLGFDPSKRRPRLALTLNQPYQHDKPCLSFSARDAHSLSKHHPAEQQGGLEQCQRPLKQPRLRTSDLDDQSRYVLEQRGTSDDSNKDFNLNNNSNNNNFNNTSSISNTSARTITRTGTGTITSTVAEVPLNRVGGQALSARGCMSFTGAKVAVGLTTRVPQEDGGSGEGEEESPWGREQGVGLTRTVAVGAVWKERVQQALGVLRIKSGRGDIRAQERTVSMSCSDKLAKWGVLGLQGGLLSAWVEPLFLSSITLSADPRASPQSMKQALLRAVQERLAQSGRCGSRSEGVGEGVEPPRVEVFVTRMAFEEGKTRSEWRVSLQQSLSPETREGTPGKKHFSASKSTGSVTGGSDVPGLNKVKERLPSSGTALNWYHPLVGGGGGGEVEVTLSGTGRKQGATGRGSLSIRTRSRLCRACLLEEAESVASREAVTRTPEAPQEGGTSCEGDGPGGGGSPQRFVTRGSGSSSGGVRSYWALKRRDPGYRERRDALLSTPAFRDWLVGEEALQQFSVGQDGVVPMTGSGGCYPRG